MFHTVALKEQNNKHPKLYLDLLSETIILIGIFFKKLLFFNGEGDQRRISSFLNKKNE